MSDIAYPSSSIGTEVYIIIAGDWRTVGNLFQLVEHCREWEQPKEGQSGLLALSEDALATVIT